MRLLLFFLSLAGLMMPAPAQSGEGGAQDPLRLELKLQRARVYPRESVPVTVTLLVRDARLRGIGYPLLSQGSLQMGAFSLPAKRELVLDGATYTAYDFAASVSAPQSGRYSLGPAELEAELLSPASGAAAFFGATESKPVLIKSRPVTLTVLPVPVKGRPEGFSGAVGRFTVSVSARPRELHAGDPVTVRTVIRGDGAEREFSCRPIEARGFKSYPPVPGKGKGELACEELLVPESAAAAEIPPVRISFFDPVRGSFGSAQSEALPLKVRPPAAPAASARSDRSDDSEWLMLSALAAIAAAAFLWRRLRRVTPPPSGDDPRQRWLAAARSAHACGDAGAFYGAAFRLLQLAVGGRQGAPAAGWTGPLPTGAFPGQLQECLEALLARCYRIRYGKEMPQPKQMAADLILLEELEKASQPHA
jgi:hypothetical protein